MAAPVYIPFLRAIFPLTTCEGFIRFVTGKPGSFPEGIYFMSVSQLHAQDTLPFDTDGLEIFFSPHTYSSRSDHVSKADTATCHALWLECDDADFSPLSILPQTPSVVIETSKGKTHSYWLLHHPIPPGACEQINKALAYKFLTKDKGGWHLTKLLRLPGFVNNKYDPPQDVHLLTSEYQRRYTAADFDVNDTRVHQPTDEALPDEPVPTADQAAIEKARADWLPQLPQHVRSLLEVLQRDRSKALWAISNGCQRVGVPLKDAFLLIWDCPNNKFKENRFNGPEGLWRDIRLAYRHATNIDRPGAVGKIRQLRSQRGLPPDVRNEEIAKLVFRTMALEGQFYFSPRTGESLYYTQTPHRLITMSAASTDCQTFLNTAYNLNGTTIEYRFVAEHIRSWIEAEAPRIDPRDLSYYDKRTKILYVTDFAGAVYRLDGERIERVHNGVDGGVFFRPPSDSEAYMPDFTAPPALIDTILETVTLQDHGNEFNTRFLMRTWFLALFFGELFETRPLMIIEGAMGSGKTVAFKCMEWLLRGSKGKVHSLPLGPKEFRVCVREKTYIFFDGIDEPWKGFAELLSTTATGTTDRQRILYTDNRIAEYEMRAFVGITTMSAHFLRHDVIDRSVIVHAMRRETFTEEAVVKDRILANRNRLWGALLQTLNQMVKKQKTHTAQPSKIRMADFASFLAASASIKGVDTEYFLRYFKKTQDEEAAQRSGVWETIKAWLQVVPREGEPSNVGRSVSANELHTELTMLSRRLQTNYDMSVNSPKALTAKLNALAPVLHITRTARGTAYVFKFGEGVRGLLS